VIRSFKDKEAEQIYEQRRQKAGGWRSGMVPVRGTHRQGSHRRSKRGLRFENGDAFDVGIEDYH